ncbi:hypothetical protein P152DRAFT_456520 [Eremomyces bilateralis CBS 781.70]|uniref:Uncharacterized protein n=1 Tax=Eremomyces bilateralis CBS 781.70 TaxID=1392243 RepID=A0A6G1G8R1_9PEZI|nr:uncharacterized protein P152DRAFT_456520 [Eremomyces bilateralis CBS 781.70]KAF1814280.1 hypothetical protein P152DRAFT_456520 [Eremomyces bilateralis CBS 781.70]
MRTTEQVHLFCKGKTLQDSTERLRSSPSTAALQREFYMMFHDLEHPPLIHSSSLFSHSVAGVGSWVVRLLETRRGRVFGLWALPPRAPFNHDS